MVFVLLGMGSVLDLVLGHCGTWYGFIVGFDIGVLLDMVWGNC